MTSRIVAFAVLCIISIVFAPSAVARDVEPTVDYDLTAIINAKERRLSVSGTAILPASVIRAGAIELHVRADMPLLEAEVIAPSRAAVTFEKGALADKVQTWLLRVSPAMAGPLTLRFRCEGEVGTSQNFTVRPEVAYAHGSTRWYPQFGELASRGTVRYHVDSGMTIIASGKRRGPAGWIFDVGYPGAFGFVAGRFVTTTPRGAPRPTAVHLLAERDFADDLARVSHRVIETLEREFGPYPFASFAIVEVPTDAAKESGFIGAAYDGFMLVRSEFLLRTKADVAHFGHEIGHQWWGNAIWRTGTRGDFMLDEALAQYGGVRAVEAIEGAVAAARFRRGGQGLGGRREAIDLVAAGLDWPLGELPHENAAYKLSDSKGYLVWYLLSETIGPERLSRAFRNAVQTHLFGAITWEELLAQIAKDAGQPVQPFFDQWFERAGIPILRLQWKTVDGGVRVDIEQQGLVYDLRIPVVVEHADGSAAVHTVALHAQRTSVTLPARGAIVDVHLDPAARVLHATAAEFATAQARAPITKARLLVRARKQQEAVAMLREAIAAIRTPDTAGVEFLARVIIGSIEQDAGNFATANAEYQLALALPVRPADQLPELYFRVMNTAKALKNDAAARLAASSLLALDAIDPIDPLRSREAAELLTSKAEGN